MSLNKRKKNSRQRGSKTHGWGAMKKHRGKGHQGGAGMAGTGKRADSKKPSVWKDEHYFGKFGFISKTPKTKINAINIGHIEMHIDKFIANNTAKKENNVYVIDLKSLGFNKILGDGRVSLKFKITAPFASALAVEKIKKAGGEVLGLVEMKEPVKAKE